MQRLGVLLLPFWLAACGGFPSQLALFTQIADGMTYVFTGKGGTDHIVSAAMNKDCALARAVQGMAICEDKQDDLGFPKTALSQVEGGYPGAALNRPLGQDEIVSLDPVILPQGMADLAPALGGAARAPYEPAMAAAAFTQPRQLLSPARQPPARQPMASPHKTPRPMAAQTPRPDPSYYVVVGSFRNWAGAFHVAARQSHGVASIVAVMRNGAKTHRVLIGPFDRVRARATRRLVRGRGIRGAWLVRSCANGRGKGCMDIPKT